MKIPLSWLQLTHEKVRLLVALAGISFADVLMFMQLGFRDALFDSAVRFHEGLNADAVVLSSQSDTIIALKTFSSRNLYEVMGVQGVESVTPVYMSFALWKNPVTYGSRFLSVVGFNPAENIFAFPEVAQNQDILKQQDVVLYDRLSRKEFGPIAEEFEQGKTITTEVSNRRIKVGGLFSMGTSFGADGNVITSDVNFFRLFPERNKGLIDIGIVQFEPDANPALTMQNIREELAGTNLEVFTKQEFIDYEKGYWKTRTNIGFIFTMGTVMGFIVGTVIVYQILYTDVVDHLPEYATLKAMGYTDMYLLRVVFLEAFILACVGYIPGYGLGMFLYWKTAAATGLPIAMTLTRAITVLILTIIMCCASGSIAVGKLRSADPADIF